MLNKDNKNIFTMKDNFIHVCFVIDKSGSMYASVSDVVNGFKRVIDEQRQITDGNCAISLYMFDNYVTEKYIGKDVNEVEYLDETTYSPGGCTSMNDGIGTAIDKIGEWLNKMDESERPEKNLIVIMTDGEENSSKEYTIEKVKEMIKHQETKYNWTFVYMGTNITDATYAKNIGISNRCYGSRDMVMDSYDSVCSVVSAYRCTSGDVQAKSLAMESCLASNIESINTKFETTNNIKITNN